MFIERKQEIEKFVNVANKLNHYNPVFFLEKKDLELIQLIKSRVKNICFRARY